VIIPAGYPMAAAVHCRQTVCLDIVITVSVAEEVPAALKTLIVIPLAQQAVYAIRLFLTASQVQMNPAVL
jgi:hypothetical protein